MIEQRIVDFQVALKRLGAAVDQANLEPPDRAVLAEVGMVATDGGEGAVGQVLDVFCGEPAFRILVVTQVGRQSQAQLVAIQWRRGKRPQRAAQAEQQNSQTPARHPLPHASYWL